jgi:hypothetical protein
VADEEKGNETNDDEALELGEAEIEPDPVSEKAVPV